jgi:hypothetical protein
MEVHYLTKPNVTTEQGRKRDDTRLPLLPTPISRTIFRPHTRFHEMEWKKLVARKQIFKLSPAALLSRGSALEITLASIYQLVAEQTEQVREIQNRAVIK